MGFKKSSVVTAAILASQASATLQPIVMKGSKFFYENGTQFYMKGIAYQQAVGASGAAATSSTGYIDPLSSETICKRDVPNLKKAGTNTIRVYAIDPTKDHTACMKLLDDAGIYVIADLGEPTTSINQDDPKWNIPLFDRYKSVIDEMGKYTNTIGFFSGNEVTNNKTNTPASAYVKAATRDCKKYIKDKGGRWMGVGYATNDDTEIRDDLAAYFNCGDQEAAIDYWGYNIYSWCGDSDLEKSSWNKHHDNFKSYSVPVFMAEYGCVDGLPELSESRKFTETKALFSDAMTDVFSGGIVFMYFEEANHYGLFDASTQKTMKNFDELVKVANSVSPKTIQMDEYTPTNQPLQCPQVKDLWRANAVLPPTPNKDTCECMTKTAACVPAANLAVKDYGSIFNFICGSVPKACAGINGNATTGVYGPYHGCDDKSKLTYVLQKYYESQNKASSACSFDGKASLTSPGTAASTCTAILSSASAAAEVAATATTASGAAGTSTNAASAIGLPGPVALREVMMGVYVAAAAGLGALLVL